MIGVQELRAGTIFEEDGNLLQVLSYEHIKMGRGSANIKVRVKNLRSGSTIDKSFINTAKVRDVSVFKRDLQYLYKDSEGAYFMNSTTFEQISVPLKLIGSDSYYLREGESYNLSFLGDEALSINLPPKMVFKVEETAPGVKGNSATNVFKDAVLENGLNVKVPLFVNIGDKIKVDTRTGAYTEKAS
ncbi:MAG TPA: elongation factor P [Candidatus Sulfotelmatobacter sp.]|nr:elongation factor P [Candidatus Sulfotelmatobacter sp.]